MAENIFSTFAISGEAMSVQRMRLGSVAKNIANTNTTKAADGQPYKREVVVVKAAGGNASFGDVLDGQLSLTQPSGGYMPGMSGESKQSANSLQALTTVDNSPPRLVYDPSHPDADEKGYVAMPNINIVTEMVEMISAQRAFEANAGVVEAAKNLAKDSLEI
jgi:flagellar basal-body rod protein FlgC